MVRPRMHPLMGIATNIRTVLNLSMTLELTLIWL